MITSNKRFLFIITIIALLLLIPLIAMQFTNAVNWSLNDFLLGGVLLLGTGLIIEFVMRFINRKRIRIILLLIIISLLLLTWAEMAVGIFGTPFAGS